MPIVLQANAALSSFPQASNQGYLGWEVNCQSPQVLQTIQQGVCVNWSCPQLSISWCFIVP